MESKEYEYQTEIKANERLDDLQYKGLKLIQDTEAFCFGVDAVLLANYADVKKGDRVIDLGTGSGIIPVLLAGKTQASDIVGLEIQPEMAEMASRSVKLNNLEDKVRIVTGDLKASEELFGLSSFNVVVTNPPYIKKGTGIVNPTDNFAISRHEILCTLKDVIEAGSKLLTPGGQFAMVHKPSRLVDILYLMRSYKIEPKYLRCVHPSPYKKANIILVKGTKGGGEELKMQTPLYVYDEYGKYTDEINEIYGRSDSKYGD